MPLILRSTKGSPLTFNELDGNFTYLSESIAEGGGGGTPATASYALTASFLNPLTQNVVITGSLTVSGSNTLINVGPLTTGDINNIAYSNSMAQGSSSAALGLYSHAEGLGTIAAADYQHVTGRYNESSTDPLDLFIVGGGDSNFSRNNILTVNVNGLRVSYGDIILTGSLIMSNQIIQGPSHFIGGSPLGIQAQGRNNQIGATGEYSHVEGIHNRIDGPACHVEGGYNQIGFYVSGSHAEGFQNTISSYSNYAHVEGAYNSVSGSYAHAEGIGNIAIGTASHAEGLYTIAKGNYQHVQGQYNATSSVDSAFIVGNGYDDENRSNLIFAAGETVSINNILKLTVRSTNPISPVEGSIMASGSAGSSKLYYYNGTTWVDLTA
jgi:hypothetical protein